MLHDFRSNPFKQFLFKGLYLFQALGLKWEFSIQNSRDLVKPFEFSGFKHLNFSFLPQFRWVFGTSLDSVTADLKNKVITPI